MFEIIKAPYIDTFYLQAWMGSCLTPNPSIKRTLPQLKQNTFSSQTRSSSSLSLRLPLPSLLRRARKPSSRSRNINRHLTHSQLPKSNNSQSNSSLCRQKRNISRRIIPLQTAKKKIMIVRAMIMYRLGKER